MNCVRDFFRYFSPFLSNSDLSLFFWFGFFLIGRLRWFFFYIYIKIFSFSNILSASSPKKNDETEQVVGFFIDASLFIDPQSTRFLQENHFYFYFIWGKLGVVDSVLKAETSLGYHGNQLEPSKTR